MKKLLAALAALLLIAQPALAAQQTINVGAAPNDGTGDPARTAFQKVNSNFTELYTQTGVAIYATSYGVVCDGATATDAALLAAINAADNLGGGDVILPRGRCMLADQFTMGNGANGTLSTIHNRITLVGQGSGATNSLSSVQITPVTALVYNGSINTAKAVLEIAGPMHNVYLRDLVLDANSKAGVGLRVINLTDWTFERLMVANWTTNSYVFTTRDAYVTGAPYGMGNGTCYDCYAYSPVSNAANGMLWTSGVSSGTTLIGNPDTASNRFIGGVLFYGGSTGSYGLKVDGADNNIIMGTQLLPAGGNDGGGTSVLFSQWAGSTQFPLENQFNKLGLAQNVGGVSGTVGNIFLDFTTADGAAIPLIANVRVLSNAGDLINATNVRLEATSTATTPLSGYASTTFLYGLNRNGSNGPNLDAFGDITFMTGSTTGPRTGVEKLRVTAAGLLAFQGITSSFPALKRSASELQVRLADDSAFGRLNTAGVTTSPVVVASLTSCASVTKGLRQFVTDATTTTFLSTVAGGGANNVPVVCDGTNWKIG